MDNEKLFYPCHGGFWIFQESMENVEKRFIVLLIM